MHPRPSGIVTFLTDFGGRDPYVGIMHGAVLRQFPKATLVDLCHEVPPQEVQVGAFFLASAVGRFPDGTVHVGVVDPGVGTARLPIVVSAHGCYWIGPDNGLFERVIEGDDRAEVRELDLVHLRVAPESRTFHGRDVFAPVAAWLAMGRYGFRALGSELAAEPTALAVAPGGPSVLHVDRFGNLVTNVPADQVSADVRAIELGGVEVPLGATYGDAAPGEPIALVGSFGLLEIAVNCGDAATKLGVERGAPVQLLR